MTNNVALPEEPSTLLRQQDAAQFLDVSVRFLENRRYLGGGPPFVRLSSRAVRYRREDLEQWIAGRTFTSTSEESAGMSESEILEGSG